MFRSRALISMIILSVTVLLAAGAGLFVNRVQSQERQAYSFNNLVRFHVIANSDSAPDQELKLRVRDAVLKDVGPLLAGADSKLAMEQLVVKYGGRIQDTARQVIANFGADFSVRLQYGKFYFPMKTTGSLTLPAGEYDALRLVIGEGRGHNWWCVLYPQLCFAEDGASRLSIDIDTDSFQENTRPVVRWRVPFLEALTDSKAVRVLQTWWRDSFQVAHAEGTSQ